jgi:hypothetical protein
MADIHTYINGTMADNHILDCVLACVLVCLLAVRQSTCVPDPFGLLYLLCKL